MLLEKLVTGAGRLMGLSAETEWNHFHSAGQFRAILERARAYADRSGDGFSLVVFSTEHLENDRATLAHLVKTLKRRQRLSDEVGWLDRRRVGVILPGTSARGAWILADGVCLNFPADVPLPACKVYGYRGGGLPDEESRSATAEQPPAPVSTGGVQPVYAMEPLFLQRMPIWKRSLDAIGAAAGLIALAPLFALVAVGIKLSSPGPVFFRQLRSGRGGKPFLLVKFRSMVVDAESRKQELMNRNEQDGPAFKIKADPRVTPLGRFLRATSIDELPQFWNVLSGEMSLVGPRPLPCNEAAACRGWQRRRLDVTPGLTCIWQVKGRSKVSFADWVRMDIQYIRKRSLWHDLKLVLQTVPAVLFGKGA